MINKFCLSLLLCLLIVASSNSENVLIVIIDGARYSETLGDTTRSYTPRMWELAANGSYISHFYNDSMTYTSRAIPALWCGTWTEVRDTLYSGSQTQYAIKPTIFEYIRKQKNLPPKQFYYVLKELNSLWLPSFDSDYGPEYWPTYHSVGSTDNDVAAEAFRVMDYYHPQYMWIYLSDVDGAGHSGNWQNYLSAIRNADNIIGDLWDKVQSDTFYADKTTMFITNDHGRHDDEHGGFSGHGDACDGCRHIQFLAIGPHIRKNFESIIYRRIPDLAVTVAWIAGVKASKASGEIMQEIFIPTKIKSEQGVHDNFELIGNYPNPFNPSTKIKFSIKEAGETTLKVYDILGREVAVLVDKKMTAGSYEVDFHNTQLATGLYFYQIKSGKFIATKKMLMVK